jgi:hypothetical protein
MTTRAMFRDGKRGAVAVLAVLFTLAVVSPSLAAPEDSITPLEQYNTPKAKALASTYKPQLVRFYEHVYWCLPWLGVVKNGIGFRQPKGITADDRYLSVWVTIDQTDDGSFAAMTRERRVSAMFSRYGVDLLRRLTAMTSAGSDADLTGFSVVLSWPKPGLPPDRPVSETMALFVDKSSLADFLAKRLEPTEFVTRAKLSVFDGKDPLAPGKLEIWEDTFNSTYKLKGYEEPKEAKCNQM